MRKVIVLGAKFSQKIDLRDLFGELEYGLQFET